MRRLSQGEGSRQSPLPSRIDIVASYGLLSLAYNRVRRGETQRHSGKQVKRQGRCLECGFDY